MKILYDTSVLIAALLVEHSRHALVFPKLELAKRREVQGHLSTHSLAGLYSVMTRLPLPLQVLPNEAKAAIADLLEYLEAVSLVAEDYQKVVARMASLELRESSLPHTRSPHLQNSITDVRNPTRSPFY